MLNGVRNIEANLRQGRNIAADEDITHLIEGQRLYAGADNLPSQGRFAAERFYNNYVSLFPAAVIMLIVGAAMLWISLAKSIQHCRPMTAIAVAAATWLAAVLALRGYVGGHVPLSNGCETMLFMAFAAAAGSAVCRKPLLKGALMLVAAMAALVAAMAGSKPQIGALMPVLASPLLAVHVALVMCSYVLFMLMAVLSAEYAAADGACKRYRAHSGSFPPRRRHIHRSRVGQSVMGPLLGLGSQGNLCTCHNVDLRPANTSREHKGFPPPEGIVHISPCGNLGSALHIFRGKLPLAGSSLIRIKKRGHFVGAPAFNLYVVGVGVFTKLS